MSSHPSTCITPPALAKRWASAPETVLALIASGDLEAFDARRPGSSRPRWRITPEAVAEFQRRRSGKSRPKPARRRRKDPNVTEFF